MLTTMTSFNALNDPDKLNRQAERIKVETLSRDMTLREAFSAYRQPSDRLEELAILNGMELTLRLKKGTLIKTVTTPSGQTGR